MVPRILDRDPTCRLALPNVCTVTSTEVDHIGDKLGHGDANLRGVCHPCHAVRTAAQARQAHADHYARARRPPERHPMDIVLDA